MTSDRTMSEPSTISAATIGNAADDGSAGTMTPARCKLRLACERDLAAVVALRIDRDLRAEVVQHQLGVVAAGFLSRSRW